MRVNRSIVLMLSLIGSCLTINSNAQQVSNPSPTTPGGSPRTCTRLNDLATQYGVETIVECDGVQYRAILPEHIKAIEKIEIQKEAQDKVVALQEDQIKS